MGLQDGGLKMSRTVAYLLGLGVALAIVLGMYGAFRSPPQPAYERVGATSATSTSSCSTIGADGGAVCPSSMSQAAWFFDPVNTSGCANDGNKTCGQSTCTAGSPGVADGPCVSYLQAVARWGTTSPLLRQNTVLTWMSGEPTATTDEVVFEPEIGVPGIGAWIVGTLTSSAAGTITVVAAKLASSNQPLQVTFSGTATQGLLTYNTTHPSKAWVDKTSTTINAHVGALSTQPMVLLTAPPALQTILLPEVNTWTTGDAYVFQTPPQVNLRVVGAKYVDSNFNLQFQGIGVYVRDVWVPEPGAAGSTQFTLTAKVLMQECRVDPIVNVPYTIGPAHDTNVSFDNNWASAGGDFVGGSLVLAGGAYGTIVGVGNSVRSTASYVDGDVILHGNWRLQDNPYFGNQIGLVYADASIFITSSNMQMSSGLYGDDVIYGSGNLDLFGHGGISYKSGAGGAVHSFAGTTLYVDFQQTKVCLTVPSISGGFGACNQTLSATNLDSSLGATTGCMGVPFLGGYCNGI
jgi:hypothetical protein